MMEKNYLSIDPNETPLPQLHQYLLGSIGPRPICFASTIDEEGRPNLAPFSFFNVFSANPPVIIFAPNNSGRDGTPKHTYLNAKQVPEVVVNVVNKEIVEKMNVAAAPWDRGKLVIAQVVKIHIHSNLIDSDGRIDQQKIGLVGRMGGAWYCETSPENMFQLAQPMSKVLGFDALPEKAKNSNILSANDLGKLAVLPGSLEAEFIQKTKEEFGAENAEQKAKKLIAENRREEALALLL
jgi:flavin reductase (DIM6/NTAB) family NADH-FMN oxidoreductase RutF